MAWETRRGRKYFYTSTRVGRRVKKTYYGAGQEAELAALVVERRREERRRRAAQRARELEQCRQVDAILDELGRTLDDVTQLLAAAEGS